MRKLSAMQVAGSAAVLRVFFDHLEETGINASTRQRILTSRDLMLNLSPSPAFASQVRSAFAGLGVSVAAGDIAIALNPPVSSRIKALEMLERLGSRQLQEQVIRDLEAGARWLPISGRSNAASLELPLRNVDWCTVADWGSAYIGVAALAQTIPGVGLAMGATAVGIWAASKIFC
jgi:hypothetical protein